MKRRDTARTDASDAAIEAMLPLSPAWLHVLLAVAGGHKHGYAIRREVEARTRNRVKLWPATLYGTLSQLSSAALLEEVEGEAADAEGGDARRRCYRLTQWGRTVLDAETRRLEELVRYAHSRGAVSEPGV